MHWKACFFLNPDKKQERERITYGFPSRRHPSRCAELDEFEKDVFNVVRSIKFENVSDNFQEKLRSDILKIKK